MKQILLTKGKFALVDDENFEWLNQWKWLAKKGQRKNNWYAYRSLLAAEYQGKRTGIFMHRTLLMVPKGFQVDHINGNGLDNRSSNLRICTSEQNQYNRKPNRISSSPYRGITWDSTKKKWMAGIQCNKKKYHLGYFNDEKEAAKVYDIKAKELYGEFARLNF